ncbi:MAG: hypothetical protein ACTSVY_10545 [Candidatus Helarchaeota archaeon]
MKFERYTVKKQYKVSYDESILSNFKFSNLKLILRKALCGDPNPSTGEFLYFRTLINPDLDEKCIQLILFYNFQKFPPHKHDYHSFLLFLDDNERVKYLIYDKGHHLSKVVYPKKENSVLFLSVMMWDHHFIILPTKKWKKKSIWLTRPLNYTLKPLHPKQIWYFWTIPSMAQLKIRSKLTDPWDPEMKKTFRDVFKCPICGKKHYMDLMNVSIKEKGKLSLDVRCKNHFFTAINDLKNQKLYTNFKE